MSPKKRAGEDKAARHEREQRIAAAQARRDAGLAKAKTGDELPVTTVELEKDEKQPTVFDMLVRHKYVGIPLRMVQARLEKKRRRQEAEAAREAKRVWDMMMLLEPGMRVKLIHVGRIGGVKYDGKLATVIADVGNRYAVRLDSVDPDGTVHEGQGQEIKIAAHNMEIYDKEVEDALAEQEALEKIRRKEERAELFRDIRQGNWKKILGNEVEVEGEDGDGEGGTGRMQAADPFEGVTIEYEDLTDESTVEELRHFYAKKKMKAWLGKSDTQDEILAKIREEWAMRLEAIKKFERSFLDAEAAINVGFKVPSVRDDFRRFIVNPAFAIAKVGLKDARQHLYQFLCRDLNKGTLLHGDFDKVVLDKRPPENGGALNEDGAYNGKQLMFIGGMAAGQYGIIHHYYAVHPLTSEARVAEILQWYAADADSTTRYQIMNEEFQDLHIKGRARKGDKTAITLAEDADSMKNSYKGMLIKITKGPGKSQRAKIAAYDGETKQCLVDKWIWDKSILEKAFDQDDDNIPTVPPTGDSFYHLYMESEKEKTITLHLCGRCHKAGYDGAMFLSKHAANFDAYSGRTVKIIGGTGKGQQTRIMHYDPGRKMCKIEPWKASVPDKTSKYKIVESEFDDRLFQTEQQLVKLEAKARETATKDEKARKTKIRRRMWAAVRIHMMGMREGAAIEAQRMVQAAEAWAANKDDENDAKDDGNIHMVNGKPVKCTWKSIVLDSEPAYEEVDVVLSDEECPAVLHIKVCQARDLIAADSNGTSDPYARIHIGDDVKGGVKTRHLPKTLNPVWNESFTLSVSQEMRKQTITVEVFDKDLIGKDDSLGKFTIPLPSLPVKQHPSGNLAHVQWHSFDPVPKTHPSEPDNNGEVEIQYELVRKEKDEDDGSATLTRRQLLPDHLSWKGYHFTIPLYSNVERNKDGSIAQPLLIQQVANGQQLYKGPTSHWKVWQSLLEEGEQLDERDDVFRWRNRLLLQPFTSIDEEGHDIYTVVDYDTGQIIYSGPDEEPKSEELAEMENQVDHVDALGDDDTDHVMRLKKHVDDKAALESAHMAEQAAAAKALNAESMTAAKLYITVVGAKDLQAAAVGSRGGKSYRYVSISVGPGGHEPPYYTEKTRSSKMTSTLEFNESFDFMLDPKQRRGVLTIEVFDENQNSAEKSLGKVEIPMHTFQPLKQYNEWHPLADNHEEHDSEQLGQVRLMYKLVPKLPPALLQIEIRRAKDLIAADSGGTSDPYVRVHVGDEVKRGQKTSVKKKDLNPEWMESFEMDIPSEQRRDVVTVECFDYDAMSADDSLGKFTIALDDLEPAKVYEEWRPFDRDATDVNDENLGQIEIKYCLLPILGPAMLDIQVLRARNLIAADRGGTSDPYVRIVVGDAVKDAVKTTVKKKTLEPVWDESFSLRLESGQRRQQLQIECFDKDMVGSDDSLGRNTMQLGDLINKHTYKEWRRLNNVQDGGPDNEGEIEIKYKLQEINAEAEGENMNLEDSSALPTHTVGGQEWANIQDPALWKSLLEESVGIPGEADKFSWRGIICHQPVHDGQNQVVESVSGLVVFMGPNPNEKVDFPSQIEQQETMRMRKLEAKGKINKSVIDTEDGHYEGGVRQGQFQGDGVFMWNDGMVYSGQYVDDLREGTGTEIFPAFDNDNEDEAGEKTFPYYEGQFLDGMRHGKGVYNYANGDYYSGMWKFNLPDGLGTYVWNGGDYLECKWQAGLPMSKVIKSMKIKSRVATPGDGEEPEERKKKKKKKKKGKKDDAASPGGGYGFESRAVKF